jgi:membrane-associated phospholipid phosphatase
MATPTLYTLPGAKGFPQVEPESSFWLRCPVLHSVDLGQLRKRIDAKVKPFTDFDEAKEIEMLQKLFDDRMKPVPNLSRFLSDAIFFTPPPAGAVLSTDKNGVPLKGISNGVELASLFEGETPGLWHRHVLNVIFDPQVQGGPAQTLSPPRQALVWAALDLAIMSALSAAWHYKWIATSKTDVKYRRRPVEYVIDYNEGKEQIDFTVLFDLKVELESGKIVRKTPKDRGPKPSPGTPRHPSYPSGHSTYSAAASEVLGCLFEGYQDPRAELKDVDFSKEFKKLANNIGFARLYGGVHWESDHELGQLVGQNVGQLIIQQLNESGIPVQPKPQESVPKPDVLEKAAKEFGENCGSAKNDFCKGIASGTLEIQQNLQFD